jgi:DNA polymerase-1
MPGIMSETPPSSGPRPRLYLIDGYSNIFRAFYAIRNLSNSRGEPTSAVYGFIQMLRKLLRDETPEMVGVALDVGRTFRSDKYEAYKANRTPMPDDLRSQIPLVRQALEAYRIPILELAGFEADDVLGTLARKAADRGFDVILVSADKDLMQLVEPHVFLYHTGRTKLYAPADVEEDFGVPPAQVADVLALMGDAVDNVPGVPGIGEKGAKALIKEYGSLEALLDRAAEVPRKGYRESLQENRDQALLSKELTVIHTDVDVAFDPEALRHDPPDVEALRVLFTDLDFFSLVEELGPGGGGTKDEAVVPAREVETPEALREALEALSADDGEIFVALLCEETPLGLGFSGSEGGGGRPDSVDAPAPEPSEVFYADFRRPGLRDEALTFLTSWLADPERRLTGHNLKELLRLVPEGESSRARLFDLMLASYLLKPSIHGHTLEEMALERAGTKALTLKECGWDKGQEPPQGDSRLALFAAERVALARTMAGPVRRELAASPGLSEVYGTIEVPLVPVLVGMEERGIRLDVEFLRGMSSELGTELAQLEETIYQEAGERFNLNSPQQLGTVLFERMGLPVLKRTQKTKSYSTGAETLEELATRGFPIAQNLLRYRELSKLKSTYVDALPGMVAADGCIHTRFQQAVAATGRLSSINPNLQNIPIRTELGQRIRKAFVASDGKVLLVADYSQIELRILAHIAEEKALIDAFAAGEDIHRATASTVLGVAPELVTGEQRRAAKTINFGILYGMSAFGLSSALGITTKDADRFIRDYLDRYPGVKQYMEETLASAEKEGKVETLYGRVRWLPDITSKNFNLRENARRMAINARIQGTAADLLKLAMIAIDRRLREELPEAKLLLTVHDELVFEVPEALAEEAAGHVKKEMEGVATLKVPLVVDAGWGKTWYDAKK